MKWREVAFLGLVAMILLGLFWFYVRPMPAMVDENSHAPQIVRFAHGDYTIDTLLLMWPVYHALVAAMARVTGGDSLSVIRLISFGGFLVGIVIFYQLIRHMDPPQRWVRTVQFAFFPMLFPFCFLVYTDVWAMVLLLLAVLSALHRRAVLCGVVMLLAVSMRSMLVVWLPLLWLLLMEGRMEGRLAAMLSVEGCKEMVRRTWPLFVTAAIFAAIVVWNRGFTVGKTDGEILSLNPTSLWFLLFVFAFLFLPQAVSGCLGFDLTRSKSVATQVAVCGVLMLVFWSTFKIRHHFNSHDVVFFLHNIVLRMMRESRVFLAVMMLPVPLGWVALTRSLPGRPYGLRWLPVLIVLSVLPMALVDPRYIIPSSALFLAFRKPQSVEMEWTVAAAYAAISVWLTLAMNKDCYFP